MKNLEKIELLKKETYGKIGKEREEAEQKWEDAIKQLVPEVGGKITICYYSDKRAATIVEYDGKRKMGVRFNRTTCKSHYGDIHEIHEDLEGGVKYFTKRRNGRWVLENQESKNGVVAMLHYHTHSIDPHF